MGKIKIILVSLVTVAILLVGSYLFIQKALVDKASSLYLANSNLSATQFVDADAHDYKVLNETKFGKSGFYFEQKIVMSGGKQLAVFTLTPSKYLKMLKGEMVVMSNKHNNEMVTLDVLFKLKDDSLRSIAFLDKDNITEFVKLLGKISININIDVEQSTLKMKVIDAYLELNFDENMIKSSMENLNMYVHSFSERITISVKNWKTEQKYNVNEEIDLQWVLVNSKQNSLILKYLFSPLSLKFTDAFSLKELDLEVEKFYVKNKVESENHEVKANGIKFNYSGIKPWKHQVKYAQESLNVRLPYLELDNKELVTSTLLELKKDVPLRNFLKGWAEPTDLVQFKTEFRSEKADLALDMVGEMEKVLAIHDLGMGFQVDLDKENDFLSGNFDYRNGKFHVAVSQERLDEIEYMAAGDKVVDIVLYALRISKLAQIDQSSVNFSSKVSPYCLIESCVPNNIKGDVKLVVKDLGLNGDYVTSFDSKLKVDIKKIEEYMNNPIQWLKDGNLNIILGANFSMTIPDKFKEEYRVYYYGLLSSIAALNDGHMPSELDVFYNEVFDLQISLDKDSTMGLRDWLIVDYGFQKTQGHRLSGYTLGLNSHFFRDGFAQAMLINLKGEYTINDFLARINIYDKDLVIKLIEENNARSIEGLFISPEQIILNGVKLYCVDGLLYGLCRLDNEGTN